MKTLTIACFMFALASSSPSHAAECVTFKKGIDALSGVIKDRGQSVSVMYLENDETDAFYESGIKLGKIPTVAPEDQYDNIAFFFVKGETETIALAMYDDNGCVSSQRMVMSIEDFVAIMDRAFKENTPMFHPVRLEKSA